MEPLVHLHAGRPIVVKRAVGFSCSVDIDAVQLCRLSGSDGLFYNFKYIHCIILSGNKKALNIFTKKTASALEFHILFFLLRSFLLRLLLLLFLLELQSLCYRVLRFGLFLNLGLFRCEDFTDPVTNIFHRL